MIILQSNKFHRSLKNHENELNSNLTFSTNNNDISDQLNITKTCFHTLIKCIYLGLSKWFHEPQVLTALAKLMNLIALHTPDP